jgi:hypothetical protein
MSAYPNFDHGIMSYLLPQDQARLIGPTEQIPAALEVGFEQLGHLDREWVWVVENGGVIHGVLLACPCHGCAVIWRISLDPSLNNIAIIRLLRRFLRDVRERGMVGLLTLIDPFKPSQARFQGMLEKVGGKPFGTTYTLMAAPIPKEGI